MLHVQAEALLPDTEGLDNTWHPGGMQFDDGGEYEERFKNMRLSTPKQREPASWRTAMHAIRNTDLSPQPTNEYPGTRYRYIVGMAETMRENGLVLHVTKTRPKKNGGWTKQKPVRLESNSADRIADPEDRRFLTLLEGGSPTDSYYYDSWGSDGVYHLSGTLMEILLPDLASSGRLYLAADAYDTADALPITLDEGYPWQFRLHVNKEEELKRYVVSGMLSRGKEGMQLKEPRMLLSSGWMFYDNRLARLDHSGAFEWIPLLRRNNQLVVPENEATDWLQSFISCPRVPPVTLPEELRFERIAVTPKPLLKLYAAKQNVDGVYLGGVLHFDYDGACLPFASDIPAFFDADKRRVIDRSLKDERAAVDRLSTLRFRMARPFYKDAYPEPCDFEIPTRHFVAAAVALVQEGWHVEADGKRYRSAGSVSLSVSSGMDWFDVNGDVDFGSAKATLPELLKALKKGSQSIVLDDGTMGILPATWLKRYGFLGNVGQTEGEAIRFSRTQASLLDALLAAEPEATFDEGFTQMCKELHTFTSVEPANPPKSFRGTLRDYQREGLGWLGFLQRFRFGGCLADDMGLGKTIQALAVLETRRSRRKGENRDEKRPSLAVVPRSLVFNWKQEADRFAPRLKVLDHSGVGRDGDLERFGNYDLVLTTYGTLRSDILKLKDVEFDYVILDEAQAIKNPATSTAKAARLLKARHRLAMSGTPIENHLGELWSLFEFLNPGMLGTASAFKRGLKAAQNGDEENVRMLSRAVRPFVLRRTKSQVAKDLPEKMEETIYCELIPAHRKQYDQLRDHYRQALLAKVDGDGMAKSKIMVLEALLRLRQAACHPGLLDRSKITRSSAKLDVLLRQIQDVMDEDHKILVFSQFTSLLAIVRGHLDKMAVTYAYLDGKTRKREAVVERFQNDPACKVFIISLKAGGLGLNLTAADYVVLLDPWWNPAVEAQAIDRTHRIGQTRRVFAYRIVARDTVEERILELQQKKKKLADSIITADNSLIRTLTRKDLELLLA
jgi:superfamily II DNA or RNA helicase